MWAGSSMMKSALTSTLLGLLMANYGPMVHASPIAAELGQLIDPRAPGDRALEDGYQDAKRNNRFVKPSSNNLWPVKEGTTWYSTSEFKGCSIMIVMDKEAIGLQHIRRGTAEECPLHDVKLVQHQIHTRLMYWSENDAANIRSCDTRAVVIGSVKKDSVGVRRLSSILGGEEEIMNPRYAYVELDRESPENDENEQPGPQNKVAVKVEKKSSGEVTMEIYTMSNSPNATITWNQQGKVDDERWPDEWRF
ncbi:hypothetical protein BU24DRAFT_416925 [Aaosphaeria arxii CBS 175.79]|uniref:Uncharacterized protein n=1 Tax=Aaosphaeria arxii CBS 175.79 TaxID=1450172 RepID=A0A6A5Y7J2_9PLEO|nr:uncharacterized protein BU24DRAFT_416925 [Aaosphaeria arxii CBS 175.79]KAF2021266.1 hypothetical protein BU24DRAFT_416925 [Aaosphaeria arxii CBS 175.79]